MQRICYFHTNDAEKDTIINDDKKFYFLHRIDRMNRERATAVLVDYCAH